MEISAISVVNIAPTFHFILKQNFFIEGELKNYFINVKTLQKKNIISSERDSVADTLGYSREFNKNLSVKTRIYS